MLLLLQARGTRPDRLARRSDPPLAGIYADWTDAERSAEMHIYRRGNHGFGMVKQGLPSDRWINLFHDWLADQGFA
jgi:hypothetical protein